jgi:hypothetical protein
MRRVRYAVVMSLDGYIAGPEDEADWITSDRNSISLHYSVSSTPFWSGAGHLTGW